MDVQARDGHFEQWIFMVEHDCTQNFHRACVWDFSCMSILIARVAPHTDSYLLQVASAGRCPQLARFLGTEYSILISQPASATIPWLWFEIAMEAACTSSHSHDELSTTSSSMDAFDVITALGVRDVNSPVI